MGNLYDAPLMVNITMPCRLMLISSCEDWVTDVFMVRPSKSIIVYLVSGAVSIMMVLP